MRAEVTFRYKKDVSFLLLCSTICGVLIVPHNIRERKLNTLRNVFQKNSHCNYNVQS